MTWAAVTMALLVTPAAAQTFSDPRLREVEYNAAEVVRLSAAVGYQTTIIFDPAESVETIAIGDSSAWQATPNQRGDFLFLKPTRPSGTTNMTVVTSARIYHFDLSAAYGGGSGSPYTLTFRYPGDAASVAPSPAYGAEARYRLAGSWALRPESITDDGERTYVTWPRDRPLPAVFARDDSGHELLVDGYMRGDRYVIDAVYPMVIFRYDRLSSRAIRSAPQP